MTTERRWPKSITALNGSRVQTYLNCGCRLLLVTDPDLSPFSLFALLATRKTDALFSTNWILPGHRQSGDIARRCISALPSTDTPALGLAMCGWQPVCRR